MTDIPFPQSRRVHDGNGSHIEPPLDQDWTDLEKLRWHCASIRVDNGGEIALDAYESNYTINGHEYKGFGIRDRRRSIAAFTYDHAWAYLNGISHGLGIAGFEVRP